MQSVAKEYLPDRYRVLAHVIPFAIPGFARWNQPWAMTYAPDERGCERWFEEFAARVADAVGKRYLPICRMSDGEFRFLLGDHLMPSWALPAERIRAAVRVVKRRFLAKREAFSAATRPGTSSGDYSPDEWRSAKDVYTQHLKTLSRTGMLAMHLTYGKRRGAAFQEGYFPPLKRWLASQGITLTVGNYAPFYFVYALLSGPTRHPLLRGRRVLIVTGGDADKQARIRASLEREGAASVDFLPISSSRSLFDRLDVTPFVGKVDIAFIGAGVGKPNILVQLEALAVPCIDCGYMIEVWADPKVAAERPYCVPDA